MDRWEKIKIISTGIATILIPLLLGYVGHVYTEALKQRELEGKFVELGVSILQQEPANTTQDVRKWAIDILDKYSGVPISPSAKKELKETVAIPLEKPAVKRKYNAEDGEDLYVDNVRYRLLGCELVNNQIKCMIDIQPVSNIDKLTVKGLPTLGQPNDSEYAYKSIISLNDQILQNFNFPVSKIFSINPRKLNRMEIDFWYQDLISWYKRNNFSFQIGFNIDYGDFEIQFMDRSLITNSGGIKP